MAVPSFDLPALRPRNKLRKAPKRTRPGSQISHSTSSPRPSMDTIAASSGRDSPTVSPPDLSDTKWEDFVRKSAFVLPMTKSPRLEQISAPPSPSWSTSTPTAVAESPQQQQQQLLVPEFAHLALASAENTGRLQPPSRNPRRSSMDGSTRVPSLRSPSSSSSSTISTSSSSTTTSTRQLRRRYSKTPVLRIGQLEDQQRATTAATPQVPPLPSMPETPVPPVPRRSARRSFNSEHVAEEYRMLLHSRTCARLRMQYEEDGNALGDSGHAVSETQQQHEDSSSVTRQDSIETIRSAIARRSPVQQRRRVPPMPTTPPPPLPASLEFSAVNGGDEMEPPEGSPTSDGTLVGFEEDAIYFKPAFTPEGALTPIPEDEYYGTPLGSPQTESPGGDSLSLQICVDLLARELKAAMVQRRDDISSGSDDDNDDDAGGERARESLQIWVMIEAYERLKEKMVRGDISISPTEARTVVTMFDTWLKALYCVHDGVVRDERGH